VLIKALPEGNLVQHTLRSLPPSVKKEEKTDLLHKDRKRNEEYQPTFRHIGFFPTQKSTL
jgi:hypothetical protein